MAASPDGIVNCVCHGQGILEIKCPYTHRYESVEEAKYITVVFFA